MIRKKKMNPMYVYNKIEHILSPNVTKLINIFDTKLKAQEEKDMKILFRLFLYEYISPKNNLYININ